MKPISECRSCKYELFTEILNLGEQYVSDFREDDLKPPIVPLVAVMCQRCKLVQLEHTTPQSEMYHENYGFKSGVSETIKKDLDEIVTEAFQWVNNPEAWLDIACNDGTLLSYVPTDVYRVGVDPIRFLCKEARQHCDIIINDFFSADVVGGDFEVITSISCFYDMPDPNQFVEDVKAVLAPKGVWIIQQNYLLTTLQLGAVDNFCHEHLEYYTLYSLEHLLDRHGLEVIDLSTSMINGGSIRTVVARKGVFPVQDSVERQRTIELDAGLDTTVPYLDFAIRAMENLQLLKSLIDHLVVEEAKRIYIIAASTRGATIWQAIGLDRSRVVCAVERNPAKVGKNFSALGIPIISEEKARSENPDYMIVGPWFFADEIIDREAEYLAKGGKLIIPLPGLEIINGN